MNRPPGEGESACVYTAVIGDYEELLEQPEAVASSAHFVCFTDNPRLRSETWEIREVAPLFPSDPVRSARAIKILSSRFVGAYDLTIWKDNSVLLKADPVPVVSAWLERADLALPLHPFRDTVLDEFVAVVESGKDDAARVYDQFYQYQRDWPTVLGEKPHATGVIGRRPSESVVRLEELWLAHVLRYSRRDQLSFNVALRQAAVVANGVEFPFAEQVEGNAFWWPCAQRASDSVAEPFTPPPTLEARRLAIELEGTRESMRDLTMMLTETQRELEDARRAIDDAAERLLRSHAERSEREAEWEAELESMRRSRSWRLTRPLRGARSRLRA